MAGKQQSSSAEERMIPVFSVFKNNVFLKNTLIVNLQSPSTTLGYVETLLLGRHHRCNVVLKHPSVSRYHLRIYANSVLKQLSVTDLSSNYGTWISEKKIEPNVMIELNEGDTFRVGMSGRVYRLHWLPLSRAQDTENPFFPPPLIGGEIPQSIRKRMTPHNETISPVDYLEQTEVVDDGIADTSEDGEGWNTSLLKSLDEMFLEYSSSEDAAAEKRETQIPPKQFYYKSNDVRASCFKEALAEIGENQSSPERNMEQTDVRTVTPMSKYSIPNIMEAPTEDQSLHKNIKETGEGFVTPLNKYSIVTLTENQSPRSNINQIEDGFVTPITRSSILNVMETPSMPLRPPRRSRAINLVEMGSTVRDLSKCFDEVFNTFPGNKENCSPNIALLERSTKRPRSFESSQPSKPDKSPLLKSAALPFCLERNLEIPERESLNFNGGETDRTSFQSLSNDEFSVVRERKKTWSMVVDCTCLLERESRKSLQLLQGIKGTRLIIPEIVIRELDELFERGGFFKKREVHSLLQWMVDCKKKWKWWIFVEGIMEEGFAMEVTPSDMDESFLGDGDILDYALSHRGEFVGDEEQLVLLSNNDNLKVAAMAEGVLCEKPQEFHYRVANPLSEGFMWGDRLITRTWSLRGSKGLPLIYKEVLPDGLKIVLRF